MNTAFVKKVALVTLTVASSAALMSTAAQADSRWIEAQAPVYSRHAAPVYAAPVANYARLGYRHEGRGGYWQGGRWIAPLAIASAIGAIAYAANHAYVAPAVTYVAPPVTYGTPVVSYVAPAPVDDFARADVNRDGFLSYQEAANYPDWQRNFGQIDSNRDGYLSRDELNAWNARHYR